jgi:putative RNA 2'-phosphotransferase
MITEKENINISKFLSLVLRHKPETIGITLDEHGWISVDTLLVKLREANVNISGEILEHIVESNNKKRFAFNDDHTRIRASQGHSVEIELGYTPVIPPEILYHGTTAVNLISIQSSGLDKRARHHVHLSKDIETALKVGSRHGKPILLQVEARKMSEAGYHFFLSDNGVWLTDHVPAKFIKAQEE